jgi:hypothetical protein
MDLCCELQKLPEFFSHFNLHQESEGDSFLEYMCEHLLQVGAINHEHANGTEHEELPFHGNHQCAHGPLAFITFPSLEFTVAINQVTIQYGKYLSPALKGYSESPFQPPKG